MLCFGCGYAADLAHVSRADPLGLAFECDHRDRFGQFAVFLAELLHALLDRRLRFAHILAGNGGRSLLVQSVDLLLAEGVELLLVDRLLQFARAVGDALVSSLRGVALFDHVLLPHAHGVADLHAVLPGLHKELCPRIRGFYSGAFGDCIYAVANATARSPHCCANEEVIQNLSGVKRAEVPVVEYVLVIDSPQQRVREVGCHFFKTFAKRVSGYAKCKLPVLIVGDLANCMRDNIVSEASAVCLCQAVEGNLADYFDCGSRCSVQALLIDICSGFPCFAHAASECAQRHSGERSAGDDFASNDVGTHLYALNAHVNTELPQLTASGFHACRLFCTLTGKTRSCILRADVAGRRNISPRAMLRFIPRFLSGFQHFLVVPLLIGHVAGRKDTPSFFILRKGEFLQISECIHDARSGSFQAGREDVRIRIAALLDILFTSFCKPLSCGFYIFGVIHCRLYILRGKVVCSPSGILRFDVTEISP